MKKWELQCHDSYDKYINVDGPLPLIIDYDDVNQHGVDILLEEVIDTLNNYFKHPEAYMCNNEDCPAVAYNRYQYVKVCEGCGENLKRVTVEP